MKKQTIISSPVEIEYEVVGRYDFDAIAQRFDLIIDQNEDCGFDLTGGKEMVIAAMGAVAMKRGIPMVQFDVKSGNLVAVKNLGMPDRMERGRISVDECIALNGGMVVGDNETGWELHSDFLRDVEKIWQICRPNCARWNKQAIVFDTLEKLGRIDDGLCVMANMLRVRTLRSDLSLDEELIGQLIESRLIVDYELRDDILRFRYKNEQVHRCITKAGNILELYGYMLLNEMKDEAGEGYSDIKVGVFVDWDGVIHDEQDFVLDTRNEIDLMLVKGLVPVFISCKNGEVHKEALYELSTMAEKFGGKYAKKILLCTYISRDIASRRYILQRAMDMGIEVIDGVDCIERDKFIKKLKDKIGG